MSIATLKKLAITAAGTAFIPFGAGTVEAATFNEVGDAGSTIPTAQDVGDGIDKIEGSLDTVGGVPDTDIFKLTYSKDVMFSAFNLVPFSLQFADIFLLNDTGSEVFSCLDCFFSEGDDGTEIFGGLLTAGEYFLKVSDRFSSQFGSYSVEITTTEVVSVPEPASMLGLLAIGAMGAGSALKRNKKGDA
ncbi:PEP-CTERM sorting domain-containing protein [Lusitaniella coriacea]|uniref:PEP-CTERM sorting domain-containing protein n=1 Tax=Lusitaniella coriacea TaxID=1983105 RepID=UPI003CF6E073